MFEKITEDLALYSQGADQIVLGPTTRPHWEQMAEALQIALMHSPWSKAAYDDDGIRRFVHEFEIGAGLRAEAGMAGNTSIPASRSTETSAGTTVLMQLVLLTGYGDGRLFWQVMPMAVGYNDPCYRTFSGYQAAEKYRHDLVLLLGGARETEDRGPAWPTEEDLEKIMNL